MKDDRIITLGVTVSLVFLVYLALFTDHLDAGFNHVSASSSASSARQADAPDAQTAAPPSAVQRVPLIANGGVFSTPIRINGSPAYPFIIDSGASDVSVPPEIVESLMATGRLTDDDFMGHTVYTLADGSQIKSRTFMLRQISLGDVNVANVRASVASQGAPALLGQSFLSRLKSWNIDNANGTLNLEL